MNARPAGPLGLQRRHPVRRPLRLERLETRRLLAAGELDGTFGVGGKVITDFDGRFDRVFDLGIAADGKIVVAGSAEVGVQLSDFALVRYHADGSLDTGFGSAGKVVTPFGAFGEPDQAAGVEIRPDGRIVAAGTAGSLMQSDFGLARYLDDGTLDAAFGTGGQAATHFGPFDRARAMAQGAGGEIVVAGSVASFGGTSQIALARYHPDGSLDSRFGGDGRVTTDIGVGGVAHDAALQADGKLVVVGHCDTSGIVVLRYNPDGTLDPTFGMGGMVRRPALAAQRGAGVAVQSDGRIVVAASIVSDSDSDFAVLRLHANGNPDTTFGAGGLAVTDFGTAADGAARVVIAPDGRIVAAGTAGTVDGQADFAVARYLPNGTLDPAFGAGGRSLVDFAVAGHNDVLSAVSLDAAGRAVIAGTVSAGTVLGGTADDFGVARLSADPPAAGAAEGLVTRLYLDLLGRLPEPDGLDFFVPLVDGGAEGRASAVAVITSSPEYRRRAIEELYGLYLARPADPAGLSAFAELLAQGTGLDTVQAMIFASDEYFARVGAANDAFLTALYRDVLGRVPDDSGRATFGGALSAGVGRGDVAAAVLNSLESAERLVQLFYRRFLQREADATGLAHFTTLLAQGLSIEQLIVEFASSAEYSAGS